MGQGIIMTASRRSRTGDEVDIGKTRSRDISMGEICPARDESNSTCRKHSREGRKARKIQTPTKADSASRLNRADRCNGKCVR